MPVQTSPLAGRPVNRATAATDRWPPRPLLGVLETGGVWMLAVAAPKTALAKPVSPCLSKNDISHWNQITVPNFKRFLKILVKSEMCT